MQLSIVGCGDAFGSGGRLQTCYHVVHGSGTFLIDCGATALIGLSRLRLDPNAVDTIFVSHLHGDHFSGLVWWMLHGQHVGKRIAPLTVIGPKGIEARFVATSEAMFTNSTKIERRFPLRFVELETGRPREVPGVRVTPFEVSHPSGAPSYALRFEVGDKVLAFSGDTEWVETLVPAALGADLFISECYAFEKSARYHMAWRILESNLDRIGARRVMLTHMGEDMLARRGEVAHPGVLLAEDGLKLEL